MNQPCQILVVENEPASRYWLLQALAKYGYPATAVENMSGAQELLTPAGIAQIDCVITAYRMPNMTGMELLAWIQEQDPSLAAIMIATEGEKPLAAESPLNGAIDLLDQPADLEKLRLAVARSVERTQRQRQLAKSETAIKQLGRIQERMLDSVASRSPLRVDVCFHPKYEAGGDFFSCYRSAPNKYFCLLTDVSGHDLQAAYVSAFFQGVVRGMLEHASPVDEIFAAFNRFLLEEWNEAETSAQPAASIKTSVAACGILIDSALQTANVVTHGTPAPVFWTPDGYARVIGENGGFPLGWFPGFLAQGLVQPITSDGLICLWTDGLAEVADKRGVSSLSLASALQQAKGRGQKLAEIDSAADDILVADIYLSPTPEPAGLFRPLILEQYHGGQAREIDEFQAYWQRSLKLAVPELPEAKLHDVLLASREALLNALRHGCSGQASKKTSFQAAYSKQSSRIRVRVCDPGPGHRFDLEKHEANACHALINKHYGLILVKHLATAVAFEREGANILMDFAW